MVRHQQCQTKGLRSLRGLVATSIASAWMVNFACKQIALEWISMH